MELLPWTEEDEKKLKRQQYEAVEKEIFLLRQMSADLTDMIEQQGDQISEIETSMVKTEASIAEATIQLQKAPNFVPLIIFGASGIALLLGAKIVALGLSLGGLVSILRR
jgi:Mg2+ and Co2+ transporter CorA